MTDIHDPTIRAALEAGFELDTDGHIWVNNGLINYLLRRYDAIRFEALNAEVAGKDRELKQLHERVAELEAEEKASDNTLWYLGQKCREAETQLTATQEALKAEREVRGMLENALDRALNNLGHAVARRPVRDVSETIAEGEAALAAALARQEQRRKERE